MDLRVAQDPLDALAGTEHEDAAPGFLSPTGSRSSLFVGFRDTVPSDTPLSPTDVTEEDPTPAPSSPQCPRPLSPFPPSSPSRSLSSKPGPWTAAAAAAAAVAEEASLPSKHTRVDDLLRGIRQHVDQGNLCSAWHWARHLIDAVEIDCEVNQNLPTLFRESITVCGCVVECQGKTGQSELFHTLTQGMHALAEVAWRRMETANALDEDQEGWTCDWENGETGAVVQAPTGGMEDVMTNLNVVAQRLGDNSLALFELKCCFQVLDICRQHRQALFGFLASLFAKKPTCIASRGDGWKFALPPGPLHDMWYPFVFVLRHFMRLLCKEVENPALQEQADIFTDLLQQASTVLGHWGAIGAIHVMLNVLHAPNTTVALRHRVLSLLIPLTKRDVHSVRFHALWAILDAWPALEPDMRKIAMTTVMYHLHIAPIPAWVERARAVFLSHLDVTLRSRGDSSTLFAPIEEPCPFPLDLFRRATCLEEQLACLTGLRISPTHGLVHAGQLLWSLFRKGVVSEAFVRDFVTFLSAVDAHPTTEGHHWDIHRRSVLVPLVLALRALHRRVVQARDVEAYLDLDFRCTLTPEEESLDPAFFALQDALTDGEDCIVSHTILCDAVVWTLARRFSPPAHYAHILKLLPQKLQKTFLQRVEAALKRAANDGDMALPPLLYHIDPSVGLALAYTPTEMGYLYQTNSFLRSWQRYLYELVGSSTKSRVRIEAPFLPSDSPVYLRRHLVDQIIEPSGHLCHGDTMLEGDVVLRAESEFPGHEIAFSLLCHLVVGGGTPFVEVMHFLVDDDPLSYWVLAIRHTPGRPLGDVLRNQTPALDVSSLSLDHFTRSFVMSVLWSPSDSRNDQFVVTTCHADWCGRARPSSDPRDDTTEGVVFPHSLSLARCRADAMGLDRAAACIFIFCLDSMSECVSALQRKEVLELHVPHILEVWLQALQQIDVWFSVQCRERSSLLRLPPDILSDLRDKLFQLQDIMRSEPSLTHIELLRRIMPEIGTRYARVLADYRSPHERFLALSSRLQTAPPLEVQTPPRAGLTNALWSMISFSTPHTKGESRHSEKGGLSPRALLQNLREATEQRVHVEVLVSELHRGTAVHKLKGKFYAQEVADRLCFAEAPPAAQHTMLRSLEDGSYRRLVLRDATELRDMNLGHLLRESPGLTELVLAGCTRLGHIPSSLSTLPSLRILDLSRTPIPEVVAVSKRRHFWPFTTHLDWLPALSELYLDGCPHLQRVNVTLLSRLRVLVCTSCPILEVVCVNEEVPLETLDVCGSPKATVSDPFRVVRALASFRAGSSELRFSTFVRRLGETRNVPLSMPTLRFLCAQTEEIVLAVLRLGLDVTQEICTSSDNSSRRLTALHFAAGIDRIDLCRLLVQFGADCEKQFSDLGNALETALMMKARGAAEYLLRLGAVGNIEALFQPAVRIGDVRIFRALLDQLPKALEQGKSTQSAVTRSLQRALHFACHKRHPAIVRWLVDEAHVDVNCVAPLTLKLRSSGDGEQPPTGEGPENVLVTCLQRVCTRPWDERRSSEIIRFLASRGADIGTVEPEHSAIMAAVAIRDRSVDQKLAILDLLLRLGAQARAHPLRANILSCNIDARLLLRLMEAGCEPDHFFFFVLVKEWDESYGAVLRRASDLFPEICQSACAQLVKMVGDRRKVCLILPHHLGGKEEVARWHMRHIYPTWSAECQDSVIQADKLAAAGNAEGLIDLLCADPLPCFMQELDKEGDVYTLMGILLEICSMECYQRSNMRAAVQVQTFAVNKLPVEMGRNLLHNAAAFTATLGLDLVKKGETSEAATHLQQAAVFYERALSEMPTNRGALEFTYFLVSRKMMKQAWKVLRRVSVEGLKAEASAHEGLVYTALEAPMLGTPWEELVLETQAVHEQQHGPLHPWAPTDLLATYVERGVNWKADQNEDGGAGGVGVVIGLGNLPNHLDVLWFNGNTVGTYRWGVVEDKEPRYDLAPCTLPVQGSNMPANIRRSLNLLNKVVVRGPGWTMGQQDGGVGGRGTITRLRRMGVGVEVKWDHGAKAVYANPLLHPDPALRVLGDEDPPLSPPLTFLRPEDLIRKRVVRGPNWHFGDQDGGVGTLGTVVLVDRSSGNAGGIWVLWDNGHLNEYGWAYWATIQGGVPSNTPCFDVEIAEGKEVPDVLLWQKMQKEIVGQYVRRGPDWNPDYGDQDGGVGCVGRVVDVGMEKRSGQAWISVSWKNPTSKTNTYRWHFWSQSERRFVYDLEILPEQEGHAWPKDYGDVLGKRVRRGPDWKWGDQDGPGQFGTVIGVRDASRETRLRVKWDYGFISLYRLNSWQDDKCVSEVELIPPGEDSSPRPPLACSAWSMVGKRVRRGPDWRHKDEDGGKGRCGTVAGLNVDAPSVSIVVQWDYGHLGTYDWGMCHERRPRYAVELVDEEGSGQPAVKPEESSPSRLLLCKPDMITMFHHIWARLLLQESVESYILDDDECDDNDDEAGLDGEERLCLRMDQFKSHVSRLETSKKQAHFSAAVLGYDLMVCECFSDAVRFLKLAKEAQPLSSVITRWLQEALPHVDRYPSTLMSPGTTNTRSLQEFFSNPAVLRSILSDMQGINTQ